MENFVMTTTLTIEELDMPVTAAGYCGCCGSLVCMVDNLDDPEELDAPAASVAMACSSGCIYCGPCS
jgi:hypothetical protein